MKFFKTILTTVILISQEVTSTSRVFAALNPLPTANLADTNGVGVVPLSALETLFANIVKVSATLVGLAAFVMFIAGGLKYMMSGGDPKASDSAKQTITMSIAGLVILLAGWFILQFIYKFTGVNVTTFTLPTPAP